MYEVWVVVTEGVALQRSKIIQKRERFRKGEVGYFSFVDKRSKGPHEDG